MYKKMIAAVMAISVILSGVLSTPAMAKPGKDLRLIAIIVNGKKVKFPDTEPYINTDGRTMVPVRFVSEKLGAEVKWEAATETAVVVYKAKTIRMPIGSKIVTIDGVEEELDTAAEKHEGRTMVPLRFVSEVMDSVVAWDNKSHSVRVTDEEYQAKVDGKKVYLDPWGREYSKNWDANWVKLTDLEEDGFYDFFTARKNRELVGVIDAGFLKEHGDSWSNKTRNWYAAQLNVDYRTIDEAAFIKAFMDNASGRIVKDSHQKWKATNTLKEYVEWVKQNKVITRGYADPEPSAAYRAGSMLWIPTRFKFMIISATDTSQTFLDNWDATSYSESYKLQKGVWYDGYSKVSMSSVVANDEHGLAYGLRSFEHMFMLENHYYNIVK